MQADAGGHSPERAWAPAPNPPTVAPGQAEEPKKMPAQGRHFFQVRSGRYQPFHLPSAAWPFSLARSYTVCCALAMLALVSLAHSFSAACCMARP